MDRIKKILNWVGKAWPFLIILLLVILHLSLSKLLQYDSRLVNKYLSAILQVSGGLIILVALNKDIIEIKQGNLFTMFIDYINSFPVRNEDVTVKLNTASLNATLESLTVKISGKVDTHEDRLVEVEKKIEDLYQIISIKEGEIIGQVDEKIGNVNRVISQNIVEIQEVNKKIDNTIIGVIKYEILGFFLMVYGVILNLL